MLMSMLNNQVNAHVVTACTHVSVTQSHAVARQQDQKRTLDPDGLKEKQRRKGGKVKRRSEYLLVFP